jgi:glycosyltransferase involved in cell wall biosynthesis
LPSTSRSQRGCESGVTPAAGRHPQWRDLRFALRNARLSDPEKRLVFVGILSERKNQEYLLEVMQHLPADYRLQLVGEPLDLDYAGPAQDRGSGAG